MYSNPLNKDGFVEKYNDNKVNGEKVYDTPETGLLWKEYEEVIFILIVLYHAISCYFCHFNHVISCFLSF
jgi:hypothetical protein